MRDGGGHSPAQGSKLPLCSGVCAESAGSWGCSAGRTIFSQLSSCYRGPAVGGRKEGRQGPKGEGRAWFQPPWDTEARKSSEGKGSTTRIKVPTPQPSAHTHTSSNSAFNPFSYKTSNETQNVIKETEMMGREHCRQDEARSQSNAQAGEPSRTQRWLKNP